MFYNTFIHLNNKNIVNIRIHINLCLKTMQEASYRVNYIQQVFVYFKYILWTNLSSYWFRLRDTLISLSWILGYSDTQVSIFWPFWIQNWYIKPLEKLTNKNSQVISRSLAGQVFYVQIYVSVDGKHCREYTNQVWFSFSSYILSLICTYSCFNHTLYKNMQKCSLRYVTLYNKLCLYLV